MEGPSASAGFTESFGRRYKGAAIMLETTVGPATHYRTLGNTGERVSRIGIGGWPLGLPKVGEQLSLRIVRTAIDRGINFMDNSWDYNGGASEIRMGKALSGGYRQKVFLMTKIDAATKGTEYLAYIDGEQTVSIR